MDTTMRELFAELEQLLDSDDEVEIEEEAATPPCEILQRGSELCIRVELPGVPRGVDTSSIDASYTDGILEIRLAVPPQLQARRIPITNGHRQLGKPT
jgi:HSP20 family molecular chaperone IbpA